MVSFAWLPNRNIPVELDLESQTYDDDPGGASAYVHGWADAVHGGGYRAYLYGSYRAVNGAAAARLPIDGVTVADYLYTSFANVSPAGLNGVIGGTTLVRENASS